MIIRITKINQVLPDITGNNKQTGKPYFIKHWICEIMKDGLAQTKEISAGGKDFNLELKEYEVTEKFYNNQLVGYQIVQDKKPFSKFNPKTSYTLAEYNNLFRYALKQNSIPELKDIELEHRVKIFATYFIGAKDCGIKIENKNEENIKEIFNGIYEGDEKIPF